MTIEFGKRRFDVLLQLGSHESPDYDRPLLARADWLVAPTLGAIVPNWLLLIPRDQVLNFRAWIKLRGQSLERLLYDVRHHLGLLEDEIIWFEHGPRAAGTSIGCGLDHVHIHMLIRPSFSFEDFAAMARSLSKLEWLTPSFKDAYKGLGVDRSYLISGCGNTTITAQDVEATGSQFFRRVVGALVNAGDSWDYRNYPHRDHVLDTIKTFRSLEGAARRGK